MLRKITYRRALQDDWDHIARVSQGVYEGQDYLPTVYSSWMVEEETEDPIRFNFVAVLGEAVVGFFSLLFTSDRSAFILSAERVSRWISSVFQYSLLILKERSSAEASVQIFADLQSALPKNNRSLLTLRSTSLFPLRMHSYQTIP